MAVKKETNDWMVLSSSYGEYRGDVIGASSALKAVEAVFDPDEIAGEESDVIVFPMSCAIKFRVESSFVEVENA